MEPPRLDFPEDSGTFLLHNAFVPECCLFQEEEEVEEVEDDNDWGAGRGLGEQGGHPPPSSPPPSLLLRSASSYPDLDSLVHVDIEVVDGMVREVCRARPRGGVGDDDSISTPSRPIVDVGCGIVFPCFVDLHTHIGETRSQC